MTVDPDKTDYSSDQNGETYYFCSAGCKQSFDKDPGKYVPPAGVTAPGG
jgi:YHS domain-containing protein